MTPEFDTLAIAMQPDGKWHAVLGRDRSRALCGLALRRYEAAYADAQFFMRDERRCPACAEILGRRSRWPQEQRGGDGNGW